MLTFDEPTHVYKWNGQPVPSVTQILKPLSSFDFVDPDVLKAAAEFGNHVHQAIDLALRGNLDYKSLHPALKPYLDAALKWMTDTNAVVVESEARLYHCNDEYAGTADLVCIIPARSRSTLTVADWKSSASMPASVGPQLAAYSQAYKSMHGKTPARVGVLLKPDATYRNYKQVDRSDLNIFKSCLNLYRWTENH